jgi:hypothetical protein
MARPLSTELLDFCDNTATGAFASRQRFLWRSRPVRFDGETHHADWKISDAITVMIVLTVNEIPC